MKQTVANNFVGSGSNLEPGQSQRNTLHLVNKLYFLSYIRKNMLPYLFEHNFWTSTSRKKVGSFSEK